MTQEIRFTGITKASVKTLNEVNGEEFTIHGKFFPDITQHFNTWVQLAFYWDPGALNLGSCQLRYGKGYESAWENVHFENNRPVRLEASTLFKGIKPVSENYLTTDEHYRTMIRFVPETEPIRKILENLVE